MPFRLGSQPPSTEPPSAQGSQTERLSEPPSTPGKEHQAEEQDPKVSLSLGWAYAGVGASQASQQRSKATLRIFLTLPVIVLVCVIAWKS
eukprot:2170659-Amphidinium_carterae.1